MRSRIITFAGLMLLLGVPASHGFHLEIFRTHLPQLGFVLPEITVTVGCELRGCCPGCTQTDHIDLRIQIDDHITQKVSLRLEQMAPSDIAALKISGNAHREGNVVIATPGESLISGFSDDPTRPVPRMVATVSLDPRRAVAALDAGGAAVSRDKRDEGKIEIVQLKRGRIVNSSSYRYQARDATLRVALGQSHVASSGHQMAVAERDRITLSGNTGNDDAVIVADYRESEDCECDAVFRAKEAVDIGNARTYWRCNSEVAVFTKEKAMSYETRVKSWHKQGGDVHDIMLQPIIRVPLNVFITRAGAAEDVAHDVANANYLYNRNRVGVQFEAHITDFSQDSNAVTLIENAACNVKQLEQPTFYVPGQLNVYYERNAFFPHTCNKDHNVIRISLSANLASLSHEIGHAFGLLPFPAGGHADCVDGLGNDNIMWSNGGLPTRSTFTIGQAFRMNVASTSQLNLNGNRHGVTRNCLPLTIDRFCPILTLDVPR
jgi:hypothetical protein